MNERLTGIPRWGTISVTFVETPVFERLRDEYFSDEQYCLLQVWLMANPSAGDVIRGSGGIRKVRWGSEGSGKRGGSRVIYFYRRTKSTIYFLTAYRKSDVQDLERSEIRLLRQIAKEIEES